MADTKRAERFVQILIHLLTHPKQKFSVTQLMSAMQFPDAERRSIQRDVQSLSEIPGKFVICEGNGPHKVYGTGLNVLDKLDLPNFEDSLLQFVFLKRIMNIYPGTASLIEELLDKVFRNLPYSKRDKVKETFEELSTKIMFMGTPPDYDESASEKLSIILQAIRSHHKIHIHYTPIWGEENESDRIPLMIVLYQGEIYLGCVRFSDPTAVYAIKLRRITSITMCKETFQENPKSVETLRSQINDLMLFDRETEVEEVHLTFPTYARPFIEDRPYHRSLKITERNGLLHVSLKVCVNTQLLQWLLYHEKNEVTVIKPEHLKKRLFEFGKTLVEKYGK